MQTPDEAKLMKLAKEVEQQMADLDRSIREAIQVATDEGRDLARQLAPIPKDERFAWLQQNWYGTKRYASILLNLVKCPPPADVPIDELLPIIIALQCESRR